MINLSLLKSALGGRILTYLDDKDVIEIMVNPDKKLWIDTLSKGRIFTGEIIPSENSRKIINIVSTNSNEVMNKFSTIISAELPGCGSRFQGMIPPSVINPSFTIRKKASMVFSLDRYVKDKIMTLEQMKTIQRAIEERMNILVVGGTSTGKTTLTNAIINEMKNYNNRIVILEDTQELQCNNEDHVFMRTTPHTSMRDLLKSTMRFRPDRIIVGEVRGGEALDLLKAWNSGHPGGVSTIHANDSKSGLDKLEQYIQEISSTPQQKMIAEAVNLIINIKKDGLKRKIHEIVKVKEYEKNEYVLEKIN